MFSYCCNTVATEKRLLTLLLPARDLSPSPDHFPFTCNELSSRGRSEFRFDLLLKHSTFANKSLPTPARYKTKHGPREGRLSTSARAVCAPSPAPRAGPGADTGCSSPASNAAPRAEPKPASEGGRGQRTLGTARPRSAPTAPHRLGAGEARPPAPARKAPAAQPPPSTAPPQPPPRPPRPSPPPAAEAAAPPTAPPPPHTAGPAPPCRCCSAPCRGIPPPAPRGRRRRAGRRVEPSSRGRRLCCGVPCCAPTECRWWLRPRSPPGGGGAA